MEFGLWLLTSVLGGVLDNSQSLAWIVLLDHIYTKVIIVHELNNVFCPYVCHLGRSRVLWNMSWRRAWSKRTSSECPSQRLRADDLHGTRGARTETRQRGQSKRSGSKNCVRSIKGRSIGLWLVAFPHGDWDNYGLSSCRCVNCDTRYARTVRLSSALYRNGGMTLVRSTSATWQRRCVSFGGRDWLREARAVKCTKLLTRLGIVVILDLI